MQASIWSKRPALPLALLPASCHLRRCTLPIHITYIQPVIRLQSKHDAVDGTNPGRMLMPVMPSTLVLGLTAGPTWRLHQYNLTQTWALMREYMGWEQVGQTRPDTGVRAAVVSEFCCRQKQAQQLTNPACKYSLMHTVEQPSMCWRVM